MKEFLSSSQKIVDWWIAFLSVFVAAVGVLIPFFFTRSLRAEYQLHLADAQKAAKDAQSIAEEIKGYKEDAQRDSKHLREELTKRSDLILKSAQEMPVTVESGQLLDAKGVGASGPSSNSERLAEELEVAKQWRAAALLRDKVADDRNASVESIAFAAFAWGQAASEEESLIEKERLIAIADRHCQRAEAMDGQNKFVRNVKALGYTWKADIAKTTVETERLLRHALSEFEDLQKVHPEYVAPYLNAALAYRRLAFVMEDTNGTEASQLRQRAKLSLQRGIDLEAKSTNKLNRLSVAKNALAEVISDQSREPHRSREEREGLHGEALRVVEEALGADLKNADLLFTKGNILYRWAELQDNSKEVRLSAYQEATRVLQSGLEYASTYGRYLFYQRLSFCFEGLHGIVESKAEKQQYLTKAIEAIEQAQLFARDKNEMMEYIEYLKSVSVENAE